jgi:ligand-binding sensor protein
VTENVFQDAVLSLTEDFKLTSYCNFIQADGSGFGICKSCAVGGLGASKK